MDRSSIYNVIHLGVSFLLIFMSYNVVQTFQTSSDYAKDGAFAIGIIYIVFCLTNLALSSYLTRLLDVRLTLILSSLSYISFTAASIKYNKWMLYTSAFTLGFGAALLWTAQGVYVAVSIKKYEQANNLPSSSTQGLFNGMFYGIYRISAVTGSLVTAYLFRLNYQQWIIFAIMTIISGMGTISLIFLRPVKIPVNTKQRSILGSLSMLLEIPFILLIPTMCYGGLAQGFIYSAIPPLIKDKSHKFFIFAFYGLINSVSSLFFGKLSDYLGRRLITFAIGTLVHMSIYGLLLIVWQPPFDENRTDIFIIMTTCLSIGDAIFTTELSSIITIFYGETQPAEAFACIKIFQSGCTAIGFIGPLYFSFSVQILYLIILLSITLITLIYEHYGVISLDTGKTIMTMQKTNKNIVETETENQVPLTALSDIK